MTGTETAVFPFERGEVAVADPVELGDGREVAERLGELLGALVEGAVELDLVVEDLLLEQRGQHDRADAGAPRAAANDGSPVSGVEEATIGDRRSSPR